MKNNFPFQPGQHVLADFYGCSIERLNDAPFLQQTLLEAAQKMGASVVSVQFNTFQPIGVSGVVVIAESHLTVHTWPEHGFAAVDFFTCGEMLVQPALIFLKEKLLAQHMQMQHLLRGSEHFLN